MLDNKSAKYWFVLYTHSKCEFKVADSLSDMQIEYFLPTKIFVRKWSDRKKEIELPLFAGYIFIYANEFERLKSIELKQVARCLTDFGKPATVPEWQIESLKKMLIEKHQIEIINGIVKGKEVQINSGVFSGMRGILVDVKNKNQLAISIELINRTVIVNLNTDCVGI